MTAIQLCDTILFNDEDPTYSQWSSSLSTFDLGTRSVAQTASKGGGVSFLAKRADALKLGFHSADEILLPGRVPSACVSGATSTLSWLSVTRHIAPSLPALPPELIARIFQYLVSFPRTRHEWVPDLKACSLVSRTWLPLSRAYLFRTLVVTGGHKRRSFGAFARLLNDPESVALRYCVRDLQAKADWNLSRPGTPMDAFTMDGILARLENVQSITLSGLRFIDGPAGTASFGPIHTGTARPMRRLRIADVRAWTSFATDFLSVLHLFSDLEELILEGIGEFKGSVLFEDGLSGFTEQVIDTMWNFIPQRLAVRELTLSSVSQMDLFLRVFQRTKVVHTMRILFVACGHSTYLRSFVRDLATFLTDTAPFARITQLGLELSGCFRASPHVQIAADASAIARNLLPALTYLPALRTFGLLVLFPHDHDTPPLICALIVAALAKLPQTVRRVQICLHMDAYSAMPEEAAPFSWDTPWLAPQLDWVALCRGLERLCHLEAVCFMKRFSGYPPLMCTLNSEEREWITYMLSESGLRNRTVFDLS